MLLGSDYTEGVAGIGVVNALEVVSAWPGGLPGLQKFKSWLEGPDERLLAAAAAVGGEQTRGGKRGRGSSRSRGAKVGRGRGRGRQKPGKSTQQSGDSESESEQEIDASESESAGEDGGEAAEGGSSRRSRGRGSSRARGRGRSRGRSSRKRAHAADNAAAETADNSAAAAAGDGSDVEIVGEHETGDSKPGQQGAVAEETPAQRYFKSSHRGVRRTWHLPASFPSQAVMDAYLKPLVDRNTARFSCGRPDTALLQQFCR
jgi:hypothetical protein